VHEHNFKLANGLTIDRQDFSELPAEPGQGAGADGITHTELTAGNETGKILCLLLEFGICLQGTGHSNNGTIDCLPCSLAHLVPIFYGVKQLVTLNNNPVIEGWQEKMDVDRIRHAITKRAASSRDRTGTAKC